MITTLHIKNIGIIDDLTVDFNNGFNVLTGETGAGKTLIIGALAIIAGGRFSKEIIRKGESYSFVEANLFLPENQNSIDGNIVVTREVYSNGRNSCKINGRLVTVTELKEFMGDIIDIHGQNDNQTLMNKQYHIKYLDNFIGEKIFKLKFEYIKMYEKYNSIKTELKNNYGDEKEKQRKIDLLKYQLNEIEEANLKIGEEEKLEANKKIMLNSEKIYISLNSVNNNLEENAIDAVNLSIRELEKIEDLGEIYNQKLGELKSIYYEIQELARDISNLNDENYFDESDRNELEERLDIIYSLKRKYGNSIEEIIKYAQKVKAEIDMIENLDEHNNKLKKELADLEGKMLKICKEISIIRNEYSKKISERINKQLADLEMPNARFTIKNNKTNNFDENGIDNIEFMISTNIGEEENSLIKIASGGEVSRIMLAIKTVLADSDEVPILIFDEIDTGISGKAAKAVGEKIKIVSKKHQVLCVTHQASIAAKGDYNYYISKSVDNNKTYTSIKLLSENEVIKEIARISSGDLTEGAINHAIEMRKAG